MNLDKIENKLLELESRKEEVLRLSRELIRIAGKAMAMMHAKDMASAKRMVGELGKLKKQLNAVEHGFEYNSLQAHQEYTEAVLLYNVISNGKIAAIDEVGEGEQAYLLGLMDLVGELKREAFEAMRYNKAKDAERYYTMMQDIYDSTLHMRFASSMLPDFRKKQDSARIQIENTANELLRLGR